jgi:hypothetical protein
MGDPYTHASVRLPHSLCLGQKKAKGRPLLRVEVGPSPPTLQFQTEADREAVLQALNAAKAALTSAGTSAAASGAAGTAPAGATGRPASGSASAGGAAAAGRPGLWTPAEAQQLLAQDE